MKLTIDVYIHISTSVGSGPEIFRLGLTALTNVQARA